MKSVSSHAQAISQCRNFLNNHGLMPIIWGDTAGAAADIAAKKDIKCAAIASNLAAEIYGLNVLFSNIEDSENNITRFVILSKEAVDPDPTNDLVITSCIFKVRNIPAALYKALGGFATNRVNLLKLESYMIDGSFTSTQFYVDIEGHPRVDTVRLALEELGFFSKEVKILGVYKAHNERNKNLSSLIHSSINLLAIDTFPGILKELFSGLAFKKSFVNQLAISNSEKLIFSLLLIASALNPNINDDGKGQG